MRCLDEISSPTASARSSSASPTATIPPMCLPHRVLGEQRTETAFPVTSIRKSNQWPWSGVSGLGVTVDRTDYLSRDAGTPSAGENL